MELRLAELLVGLSSVSDLGMGLPLGDVTRACVLATRLAMDLGIEDAGVADVYYTALLQHVGCTAYSHEVSALFRDELALKRVSALTDFTSPVDVVRTYLPGVARAEGVRGVATAVVRQKQLTDGYTAANCEVASMMARRLGLPESVQAALLHIFAWWNGKGRPRGMAGDEVAVASRVTQVATVAVMFDRLGEPEAAVEAVRRRAGGTLDPGLAVRFRRTGPKLLQEMAATDPVEATLEAEPKPWRTVPGDQLDEVLRAFGDAVDLKTPYLHGHAATVAELAAAAGPRMGLDGEATTRLRRAALVHDLGRVAIPSSIWDRPGPLGRSDWEQVRTHAYRSERILAGCPALENLAPVAGMHHERLDGSGYHRQASGPSIPMPARILGVADAYEAMTRARPHRPELGPERAADQLREGARGGQFDGEAVEAVLGAAGHRVTRTRPARPAGLSERQVEVLRLVAAGLSNREVAQRLHVSPRTAEHHVQDIYTKIGVSSRAAAAMFAMEHHLIGGV
ncbi:MAG: LuxR C-terminal-related transcriptional regulator [Actinomycetota bacterium]|nr:LuxR C-terminal-related transcriptional regulator [Actinomycetota bacterium]